MTTGIVTAKLASSALEKPFFKKIVTEIGKRLGSKAIGSVAGGAVGIIGGPVGTVAGTLVGGTASVGIDYGALKLDELWNRDAYKAEIVQTIEESRAQMLATVQGIQEIVMHAVQKTRV